MFWKFNKKALTLDLEAYPGGYQVDLERCNTSAEVLDWIIQISKKTWATDEILSDLVRQLDQCLHLQKNLCSCGVDKRFNARRWLLSQAGKEHRYVTTEIFDTYLDKIRTNPCVVSAHEMARAFTQAIVEMPEDV
ncbi:MAG: hypothetical protein ABIE47_13180 [Pseudomonadota bacterium]